MAYRIYTRTGDQGETGLRGGQRVPKDSLRVEAYGTLDELNAQIGLARATASGSELDTVLAAIQNALFRLGADLANPQPQHPSQESGLMGAAQLASMEQTIDQYEGRLAPLRSFILPGGSPLASHLHVARAVCRRAERRCVTLARSEPVPNETIRYLNRLSDLLFVLARAANLEAGYPDVPWRADADPTGTGGGQP